VSISNNEATERLSGIEIVEALRDLISQLDVTGTGDTTVLYNGGEFLL
jgi:hypothetical protein